ncbi:MAG: hypothetical protein AAB839_00605 [Patescibacteria group bacterium]
MPTKKRSTRVVAKTAIRTRVMIGLALLMSATAVAAYGFAAVGAPQGMLEAKGSRGTQSTATMPIVTNITWTGDECKDTLAEFCSELLTQSWLSWCEEQRSVWAAAGVTSINPCANSKYARDACAEYVILTQPADVPDACEAFHWTLVAASQAVKDNCLYTTKKGGVCYGVKADPVDPGTAPEDVVVPLDDCLDRNYETLTTACQEALTAHHVISEVQQQ